MADCLCVPVALTVAVKSHLNIFLKQPILGKIFKCDLMAENHTISNGNQSVIFPALARSLSSWWGVIVLRTLVRFDGGCKIREKVAELIFSISIWLSCKRLRRDKWWPYKHYGPLLCLKSLSCLELSSLNPPPSLTTQTHTHTQT